MPTNLQRRNCELADLARHYIRLEKLAQAAGKQACTSACSQCRKVCCREIFCHESRDSAWLVLVRQQSESAALRYDTRKGWLAKNGCRLSAGRPPVCYEFFCSALLANPTNAAIPRARTLAKILSGVGARIHGGQHLVTLDAENLRLERVRLRLAAQLSAALAKAQNV
jgi:hypothetical protein